MIATVDTTRTLELLAEHRETERQLDRETERQLDRETERQLDLADRVVLTKLDVTPPSLAAEVRRVLDIRFAGRSVREARHGGSTPASSSRSRPRSPPSG